MDRFREAALEIGVIPPPEGISWGRHLAELKGAERQACIAFLRSLSTVSSPAEDAIREEIREQLARLPENPTEADYRDAGIVFVPATETVPD